MKSRTRPTRLLASLALFVATLSVAAAPPAVVRDQDVDGMEDAWELANDLSPTAPAEALLDSDGDGFSNLVEYYFGTNPRNAASRPSVVLDFIAGQPRLQWTGLLNKRYQVESTLNLVSGLWSAVGAPIIGDGAVVSTSEVILLRPAAKFYRVRALPSADRDGDGLDDWLETAVYGSNTDRRSSSGTGIPDGWAVRYGMNPLTVSPTGDSDGDGAGNLAEYSRGTNPGFTDPPVGDAAANLRVFTSLES